MNVSTSSTPRCMLPSGTSNRAALLTPRAPTFAQVPASLLIERLESGLRAAASLCQLLAADARTAEARARALASATQRQRPHELEASGSHARALCEEVWRNELDMARAAAMRAKRLAAAASATHKQLTQRAKLIRQGPLAALAATHKHVGVAQEACAKAHKKFVEARTEASCSIAAATAAATAAAEATNAANAESNRHAVGGLRAAADMSADGSAVPPQGGGATVAALATAAARREALAAERARAKAEKRSASATSAKRALLVAIAQHDELLDQAAQACERADVERVRALGQLVMEHAAEERRRAEARLQGAGALHRAAAAAVSVGARSDADRFINARRHPAAAHRAARALCMFDAIDSGLLASAVEDCDDDDDDDTMSNCLESSDVGAGYNGASSSLAGSLESLPVSDAEITSSWSNEVKFLMTNVFSSHDDGNNGTVNSEERVMAVCTLIADDHAEALKEQLRRAPSPSPNAHPALIDSSCGQNAPEPTVGKSQRRLRRPRALFLRALNARRCQSTCVESKTGFNFLVTACVAVLDSCASTVQAGDRQNGCGDDKLERAGFLSEEDVLVASRVLNMAQTFYVEEVDGSADGVVERRLVVDAAEFRAHKMWQCTLAVPAMHSTPANEVHDSYWMRALYSGIVFELRTQRCWVSCSTASAGACTSKREESAHGLSGDDEGTGWENLCWAERSQAVSTYNCIVLSQLTALAAHMHSVGRNAAEVAAFAGLMARHLGLGEDEWLAVQVQLPSGPATQSPEPSLPVRQATSLPLPAVESPAQAAAVAAAVALAAARSSMAAAALTEYDVRFVAVVQALRRVPPPHALLQMGYSGSDGAQPASASATAAAAAAASATSSSSSSGLGSLLGSIFSGKSRAQKARERALLQISPPQPQSQPYAQTQPPPQTSTGGGVQTRIEAQARAAAEWDAQVKAGARRQAQRAAQVPVQTSGASPPPDDSLPGSGNSSNADAFSATEEATSPGGRAVSEQNLFGSTPPSSPKILQHQETQPDDKQYASNGSRALGTYLGMGVSSPSSNSRNRRINWSEESDTTTHASVPDSGAGTFASATTGVVASQSSNSTDGNYISVGHGIDGNLAKVTAQSLSDAAQGQVSNGKDTPREVHDELASLFGSPPSSADIVLRSSGESASQAASAAYQRQRNATSNGAIANTEQLLADCQLDCQRLDDLFDGLPGLDNELDA